MKEEKESLEVELEELRQALMQTQEHASKGDQAVALTQSASEKIVSKIKKKYEKKLASKDKELEEVKEEFYYEQQLLLESLMEQRRDMRLLELICEAVVPSTELKYV